VKCGSSGFIESRRTDFIVACSSKLMAPLWRSGGRAGGILLSGIRALHESRTSLYLPKIVALPITEMTATPLKAHEVIEVRATIHAKWCP